jgi:hypothetical protein
MPRLGACDSIPKPPFGRWMLFLMNDDTPCKEATWVRLTASPAPPAAPGRMAPGGLLQATSSTFEAGVPAVFTGGAYAGAQAAFNFSAAGAAVYSGAAGASVTVVTPSIATWHIQVGRPGSVFCWRQQKGGHGRRTSPSSSQRTRPKRGLPAITTEGGARELQFRRQCVMLCL